MTTMFTNAQHGIKLAQAGRKREALDYLRLAVQTEPSHAEVWLWLAYVTPSREEYAHCVQEALAIAPAHSTARQMNAMLQQQGNLYRVPMLPPAQKPSPPSQSTRAVDDRLIRKMQRQRRARARRRFLFFVLLLCSLLAVAAGVGLQFQGMFEDDRDTNRATDGFIAQEVNLTPVNRDLRLTFSLELPESWLLADTTSAEWQTLIETTTASTSVREAWGALAGNLSAIEINPANDNLQPPMSLVETDMDAIAASDGRPAYLQLVRLGAPYASMDNTSCIGMQQLAADSQALLSINTQQDATFVEQRVIEQPTAQCIFYLHFRIDSNATSDPMQRYILFVPVGETLLAEWHLNLYGNEQRLYEEMIQRLLQSIQNS